MKKYLVGIALVASTIVTAAQSNADYAETCNDETATMLPITDAGIPIEIVGSQITRTEMARLWEITTTRRDAYLYLGKIIGAGQNWFGTCEFPGLGIATGSGWGNPDYKNVTLWVWAAGVDIAVARQSVHSLVADAVTTTTSTTTTTTTTTTLTPASAPDTTTTTTPAPDTTSTEPVVTLAVITAKLVATTAIEVAAAPQSSGTVATVAPPAEPIARTSSAAVRSVQTKAILKKKVKKDEQRVRGRKRICQTRWAPCGRPFSYKLSTRVIRSPF